MSHVKEEKEQQISTELLAEAISHQQKAMQAWLKYMQKETDVFESQSKQSQISEELRNRIDDLRANDIVKWSRSLFFHMSIQYVISEHGEISENDELSLHAVFEILNEI